MPLPRGHALPAALRRSSRVYGALLLALAVAAGVPAQEPVPPADPKPADPKAADPKPADPKVPDKAAPPATIDPKQVADAADKGVDFLKKSQNPNGSFGPGKGPGSGDGWQIGYTSLACITLIECGTPLTDPGLLRATELVRASAIKLESTYEAALAILFLNRMNNPKRDDRIIQMLGARLIAGQSATGGWGYKIPKLDEVHAKLLLDGLRKLNPVRPPVHTVRERPGRMGVCIKMAEDVRPKPAPASTLPTDPEKLRVSVVKSLPPELGRVNVLRDADKIVWEDPEKKSDDPYNATTDNSNTHFAILGVWTARRHDVPVDRTFSLLVRRFHASSTSEDGWGYYFSHGDPKKGTTPAMTCVALLGLAIGHALGLTPNAEIPIEKLDLAKRLDDKIAGKNTDPKPAPPVAAESPPDPAADPAKPADPKMPADPNAPAAKKPADAPPGVDLYIRNGFVALSKRVGAPAGNTVGRPEVKSVGGLYYLWAMERVAVLYELPTLANKDWYRWGAEILLCHQQADGSWADAGFHGTHPVINTSLALLFLKRANLTPDLSKLQIIDPDLLAKSVTDTAVKEVPKATPPPPPPVETVEAPPPPPEVKMPEPKVAAVAPAPVESVAAVREPEKKSSIWPWVLGALALLLVGGGGAYLVAKQSKGDDDDKPRKKKRKRPADRAAPGPRSKK